MHSAFKAPETSEPVPNDDSAGGAGNLPVGVLSIVRRVTKMENGPRPTPIQSINYALPHQEFIHLHSVIAGIIRDCGACSVADARAIPALASYSKFQIDRAFQTAVHHGLIRVQHRTSHNPDAQPEPQADPLDMNQIYELDPFGPIDKFDSQEIIDKAKASRRDFEYVWNNLSALGEK
jgi:hypothetical protein